MTFVRLLLTEIIRIQLKFGEAFQGSCWLLQLESPEMGCLESLQRDSGWLPAARSYKLNSLQETASLLVPGEEGLGGFWFSLGHRFITEYLQFLEQATLMGLPGDTCHPVAGKGVGCAIQPWDAFLITQKKG
jgi:hypothetical protein